MPLMPYACSNCGFWQKYFAPPPDCPVCTDTRNDLPHDGWHFRPAEEVRGMLRGHWRRLERDMVAFSTSPPFGLNGTGWLLLHPDGNVAFEAAPFYTDDMLAEIERLGGIRKRLPWWGIGCVALGAFVTFCTGEYRASLLYFAFDIGLVAAVSLGTVAVLDLRRRGLSRR